MLSDDQATAFVLEFPKFEGTLGFEGQSLSVSGSIRVRKNGAIECNLDPVPHEKNTDWLVAATGPGGMLIPRFKIQGRSSEGVSLESEQLNLLSQKTSTDSTGRWITCSGYIYALELKYRDVPALSTGTHVRYFPIGMKCYPGPTVVTALGRVTLTGSHEIENPEHINGELTIEAPQEDRPMEEWLAASDKLAEKIFDMVSFAEGRFFRGNARQIGDAQGIFSIRCEGTQSSGSYQGGAFHFLNLQPALDLAINNYTDQLCEATGFPVALEWFVHHPFYRELQLFSAMTALEHLVKIFIKRHGVPPIVQPELFDKLLQTTKSSWASEKGQLDEKGAEALDRLTQKLNQINEGSFRDKLELMIDTYRIPLGDVTKEQINQAVKARNVVVHTGLHRGMKGVPLYQHVAILRELLQRIFLTLLGYQGQYWSILAADYRSFPPRPSAAPTL